MASVCMPQNNYQQHNFNMILFQQQQQSQQQPHQQQHHQQQVNHYAKPQRIAPAQPKILRESNLQNMQNNAANGHLGPLLQKRKYSYGQMPYVGEQLPSVARRNARERNRVKQVNNGFANLRQHLPQTIINTLSHGGRGASKKLSKVDTLRIAVEYIRGLQDMLDETRSGSNAENLKYDDNSDDGSQYDYSTLDGQQQHANYHSYHSEASASPTPSYCDSDISIGGANNYIHSINLDEQQQQPIEQQPSLQYKLEEFDNYDHSEQPENDDELIEYISLWQEQ